MQDSRDAGRHGAVGARRHDQHRLLPGQQAGKKSRAGRLSENLVGAYLVAERLLVFAEIAVLLAQLGLQPAQDDLGLRRQGGRAHNQADGQRQEHRDNGDQVIPEIDH